MNGKIKVFLAVFLVSILGCFTSVFADSTSGNYVPENNYSSNLVANYKLDETTGTNCIDSVHNNANYNGTYNGTTGGNDSNENYRSFNGSSDYISFSNSIVPVGEKTIKFKLKMSGNPYYNSAVLDNAEDSFGNKGITIYVTTDGKIQADFLNGQSSWADTMCMESNKKVCDNKWHTVVLTWDGTTNKDGIKWYIDDLVNPDSTFTSKYTMSGNATNSLMIGRSNNDNYKYYFQGALKDIEIYNTVVKYDSVKTGITLNKSTDSIPVGSEDLLTATISPDNVTDKSVNWSSSNAAIATVDSNGKVKAVGVGAATITATTVDGQTATCTINVTSQGEIRELLTIKMVDGSLEKYDLSKDELNDFVNWVYNRADGIGKAYYVFTVKPTDPYTTDIHTVFFDKIVSYEIQQYTKQ
ncbi:Ig-like domain-containing protein [Clostridium felsineum]|uniref:Uncharacterized protein n=1 Tax=Clostridium felsineum TaxID=36839 RepID=A0A1S8LE10_9CLOT|nr:LamG-like jellyroll fold domain-containing protein [Clostridium felsineum]URZ05271.1 hypothetical protein CLROS_005950 [Clostridium felsineum]URZ10312.1 hypothetical protein CROST_010200 [Clostridium felsineum]